MGDSLYLLLGSDRLLDTLENESYGSLYTNSNGVYIYETAQVYKLQDNTNLLLPVFNKVAGGLTVITQSNVDKLLLGESYFPRQKFYVQSIGSENVNGWTAQSTTTSGECSYLLSDDGDNIELIPILSGNSKNIGNRIDLLLLPNSSNESDTGIPETATITDLEAAI